MVIGTPVDEHLNPDPGRDPERPRAAAPLPARRADPHPAQHRLPGRDGAGGEDDRRPRRRLDVAFCPERIAEGKAMTELFELPQIVSARTARGVERASALFRRLTEPPGRADAGGSRAGQAVHQRLAVHQVRHRQSAVHDGQRPRPGLRADPAGHWGPTTRGPPTCRPRASPPGRACSRTPCSWRRSTTTTSPSATPRWPSTRACRCTWCTAWSSATTWPSMTVGILRHGLQGRLGRHPVQPVLQAQADPGLQGRRRCCAPTRT